MVDAIVETFRNPDLKHALRSRVNYDFHKTMGGREVLVGTYLAGNKHRILTAHPADETKARLRS